MLIDPLKLITAKEPIKLDVNQETDLLPLFLIPINGYETTIKYPSKWLMGKNLRCSVKLETDYSKYIYGNITQLIVWYQNDNNETYQLLLDSDGTSLFSKEYFIDLPLTNYGKFRLEIEMQASTNADIDTSLHLVKTLSTHRCWNTYQHCPVFSCSPKDINNQSSVQCSFSPELSFNCSTPDLCIYQDEVCDYEINCPDGSDELNCDQSSALMSNNTSANELNGDVSSINNLRCSFEVDYCSWRPFKLSNESCFWGMCSHNRGLIRTVAAKSLTQGPTFDHSENPKGHYLLLKSSSKRGRSTGSIVSSTPIGGNCKLVLHYLTNSRYSQVLIRSSDNSSSFNPFSTIEVIDLDWEKSLFTRVEVDLDLSGEWLFLVTMIKGDENSYLALDDIYFTKGCYALSIPESSLLHRSIDRFHAFL
uniref:MAM domain-containing protein n=1 Tax=Tetranychus urticae TaxID=32264 RepID=T1KIT0_TETUR